MKYFLIFVSVVLLSACSIQGNFKGLFSYKNEIEGMPGVVNPQHFTCDLTYDSDTKLTIINGSLLKECLQNEDKSLVHLWNPNCSSDKCISLNILQKRCNEKITICL